MDNVRNKWIIIISIIFALLTIAVSYFGSLFSQGWQDLGATIAAMMVFVQYLVTIIALILGYGTIISEIERGSMSSLVSLSATRLEILLGKFLGLGAVLSLTIVIGFGAAGLVIAANVSNVNVGEYLIFLGATILFALIFLSIAMFISTVFKKRSSAIGGAVLIWFFFLFFIQIIFTGVLAASVGLKGIISGTIPEWYYGMELINPVSVYSDVISINVAPIFQAVQGSTGISLQYPWFITNWLLLPIMLVWIVVFFCLAFWRFQKLDI